MTQSAAAKQPAALGHRPTGKRPRILSGMRPTGKLHLGNYLGALQNWVELQEGCDNFHMVADWHALTTDHEHVDQIIPNTIANSAKPWGEMCSVRWCDACEMTAT